MYAKTMSAAAAAVLFSLVAIDGAPAEGGCGPGFHRNEFGRCRPNGPVVVAPGAPVVVAPAAPVVVVPAPVVLRRRLPLASALPSMRGFVKRSEPNLVTRSTAFRRGSFFEMASTLARRSITA
jgi:hypothetical protein